MHIGTVDQLTIGGLGGEVAEMLCLLIFVDARFCSESHQFFAHACFLRLRIACPYFPIKSRNLNNLPIA